MKTTLTLEDVERLEELREKSLHSHHATSELNNKIHELLPLILPVIREHVGNPEGLHPPVQASLDQGTDVLPVVKNDTFRIIPFTEHGWEMMEEAYEKAARTPTKEEADRWDTLSTAYGGSLLTLAKFGAAVLAERKASAHPGSHPAVTGTKAQASPESDDKELLDWLETQSKASSTGISFDYVRYVEDGQVLEKGYRFMRRHFLGERKDTLRAAIRAARAKEAQQASTTTQKGWQGV